MAIALYFTSADDLETVDYFFDFQETNESPMNIQYPVTDLLVSGHEVQSEFVKPFTCNSELTEKKIPLPGSFFKYCKTLSAASRCGFLGLAINWLSLWTAKVMSGLVMLRYSSLPTNLLYCPGSSSNKPSCLLSFKY